MAELITIKLLAIAILGGVLPALVWLWFWHRQDRECPEPKGLVMISFLAGMAIVFFVLPVQKLIVALFPTISELVDILTIKLSLVPPSAEVLKNFLLASSEEIGKYLTVFLIAFYSKYFDEPIDAVIYLITVALGFTAMENVLYLLKDLTHSGGLETIMNGNMRFLGATILHTVSSAFVGIALAFSFHASRFIKSIVITIGLLVAILLHTHFNLSIIEAYGTINILSVFSRYWAVIIGIIILIGIIKYINTRKQTCSI
jgi:RsiW-degrading membrane proteinase PrsW (M82 family)